MAYNTPLQAEINKYKNGNTAERRRKFIMWKLGIDTSYTKYSEMTEEEFLEWSGCSGNQYFQLQRFEESPAFKKIKFLHKAENFNDDVLEVYEAVKKEAMKGNSATVNAFLKLQNTINKRIKDFEAAEAELEEETEEDDGLMLDI